MIATRLALVSCPVAVADGLARHLVETGLAACVNVVPRIASVYRWKGEVILDEETLLLIKTTVAGFEDLKRAILARHPYDLPEVIGVDIAAGHVPYLEWIAASVNAPSS